MPVIGHAFVGIITAHGFEPGGPRNTRVLGSLARTFWTPTLVALAYFPDIVTQLGLALGLGYARLAGHSMPIGVLAGIVLGFCWSRISGGSLRLLIGLSIGSILLHDVLDLLHASDRVPLWPIRTNLMGAGWRALPNRLVSEIILYGTPCAAYEAWRFYARPSHAGRASSQSLKWVARVLVIALVIAAVFVQSARGYRRRQLNTAERLLRRGEYSLALEAAEAADGWPVAAAPGRIDLLRGEAYEGLGDLARAEASYLRADRSDPENFWAVADLAEYYAAHASSSAEGRRQTSVYVEELRRRFSHNKALPRVLDRVERSMSRAR
jgi:membrane-bound metal-dependent hydrolase YbcI (DUF457 family)